MSLLSRFSSWFGRGGALGESKGLQNDSPGVSLGSDLLNIGVDGALQLSTVWACIDRRATTIASLPFFIYESKNGQRTLARNSRLYGMMSDSPNSRMTPFEFWRSMVMNHDLHGNAYARIDRNALGEAVALWPMPASQVESIVLDDGAMVYKYTYGSDIAILAAENVLHIKNLGNGTTGLAKLEFMRPATTEAAKSQEAATKVFGSGGKPTGVLMVDNVLSTDQRTRIKEQFKGLAEGSTGRLMVLEANMKYQQLSLSPEDQQLLETRKFSVEELCRWFDVPPVLVHHSNVTAWGTGIFEIKDGFYTLSIAPLCKSIEQAFRKRVMSPRERASMTGEFSMDALLRASIKDRFEIYAKAVQNGLKTRNECRQLENDPPMDGGDDLTAQSNLVPIDMLGQSLTPGASHADSQDTIAQ